MQEVCIVIPCFNEGKRLPVKAFESYISVNQVFFCFVDDGSSDDTYDVLVGLKNKYEEKVLVIKNESNIGKAESVRIGMNASLKWKKFRYLGYFDADLSTPLTEISHLISYLETQEIFGFALGSRMKRLGAEIERSAARHYVGRIFATIASIVLKLPVYDTQCGAKIIKSEIAEKIFGQPFLSRWLFDIELIARANKIFHFNIFIEIPLNEWKEVGDTKIRLIDMFKLPLDLLRIIRYY